MHKRGVVGLCLVFSLFANLAKAEISVKPTEGESLESDGSAKPDRKWWFYLGVGFAPWPQHSSNLNREIGNVQTQGLWSIFAGQYAMPGVYRPSGDRDLLGVMASGLVEQYGRDRTDPRNYAIRAYSLFASWLRFCGPKRGQGLYYRGEFGPTYLETANYSLPLTVDRYGAGATIQLSVGYALNFFESGEWVAQFGPYWTQTKSYTLWGGIFQLGVFL